MIRKKHTAKHQIDNETAKGGRLRSAAFGFISPNYDRRKNNEHTYMSSRFN